MYCGHAKWVGAYELCKCGMLPRRTPMDYCSEQLQIKLVQQPGCQSATPRAHQRTLTASPIGTVHQRHPPSGPKITKFRRLSSGTPPEPGAQMVS